MPDTPLAEDDGTRPPWPVREARSDFEARERRERLCRYWDSKAAECDLGCDAPCPRVEGAVWPGGCLYYLQTEIKAARGERDRAREEARREKERLTTEAVAGLARERLLGVMEDAIQECDIPGQVARAITEKLARLACPEESADG